MAILKLSLLVFVIVLAIIIFVIGITTLVQTVKSTHITRMRLIGTVYTSIFLLLIIIKSVSSCRELNNCLYDLKTMNSNHTVMDLPMTPIQTYSDLVQVYSNSITLYDESVPMSEVGEVFKHMHKFDDLPETKDDIVTELLLAYCYSVADDVYATGTQIVTINFIQFCILLVIACAVIVWYCILLRADKL